MFQTLQDNSGTERGGGVGGPGVYDMCSCVMKLLHQSGCSAYGNAYVAGCSHVGFDPLADRARAPRGSGGKLSTNTCQGERLVYVLRVPGK